MLMKIILNAMNTFSQIIALIRQQMMKTMITMASSL
jgi:hypothetical protein